MTDRENVFQFVEPTAAYINKVLSKLYEYWETNYGEDLPTTSLAPLTASLTTHSSRGGAATYADENPIIKTEHVILRGGWTVEGIQTVFHYIAGTDKIDGCASSKSLVGMGLSNSRSFLSHNRYIRLRNRNDKEGKIDFYFLSQSIIHSIKRYKVKVCFDFYTSSIF